jgi:hypothetical protein
MRVGEILTYGTSIIYYFQYFFLCRCVPLVSHPTSDSRHPTLVVFFIFQEGKKILDLSSRFQFGFPVLPRFRIRTVSTDSGFGFSILARPGTNLHVHSTMY